MACSDPRSDVLTLVSGTMTPTIWNRTAAKVSDPTASRSRRFLDLVRPTVTQAGSANSTVPVDIYWSESDETPTLAEAVAIGVLDANSSYAFLDMTGIQGGYVYLRANGGAPQIHCWERF